MNKKTVLLMAMLFAGAFSLAACSDTDLEKGTQNESEYDSKDTAKNNVEDSRDTAEHDVEEHQEEKRLMDTNDVFKSADLCGTVKESSKSGCTILEDLNKGDTLIPGGGDSIDIVYDDNTIFQMGKFQSDGSSYELTEGKKSNVTEDARVLVFGSKTKDGTYLATKIIITKFVYHK